MNLLAMWMQQSDLTPQQQHALAGLGFGIFAIVGLLMLVFYALFVWLFWRSFTKAGMAGALGLLALIPGFGFLIALCVLAFGTWNVAPIAAPSISSTPLPPAYPPQYPPSSYPPNS